MKSRPSILIAVILSILPLLSCTNPIIEEFFARDKGQNKPPNDPEIITVSGVSLNINTLELTIDGSTTLTASVQPENATNRIVTWSSSDDTVAAVDDGLVTALAEGTVTITVTAIDGGHTASCEVTVEAADPNTVAVTGISLNTNTLRLPVGETETLSAEIEPGNATNQTVNWTSTNTGVATVDAVSGVVTALGEGSATITVTTVSEGKTASCEVTVFIPVTGVSLSTATLTLLVSETETLSAEIEPENATTQNVTWTSSDDLIAAVNDSGEITALAEGRATVTVTTVDGNHSATCTVTVKESTGEADAPFLIYNEFELLQVGTGTGGWILSAHYKLMEDITLNGEWTTIGDNSSGDNATRFTGGFNGNNKTITGLSANKPKENLQGMFGYVGSGGEVKNLTLLDCNVSGKSWVGGVAGILSRATIINCRVDGNVSGIGIAGGVVGQGSQSTVENCYTKGEINGDIQVGGVAGYNYQGTITNCNAEGVVRGIEMVGGVAGYSYNGEIANSYATGNVYGEYAVGGVVGFNQNTKGTVKNSYATGNVYGEERVGGVAGYNEGTVENCYATVDISGRIYVGGVAGQNEGTITNSYADGVVSGAFGVGGVAGWNYNGATVENCYATGNVKCTSTHAGGVVGDNDDSTVRNSHATGDVSGFENIGGVAGRNSGNATVENCYATGNVVSERNCSGGVAGVNSGLIANCYSTGNVRGIDHVGGVVGQGGWNSKNITRNCYATGNVSGNTYVGGVVGYSQGQGTVENCYATGNVSGKMYVGGVVGYRKDGTVKNCVALNPNINSSTGTLFGRIGNGGTMTNNHALLDMKINNSAANWTNDISGNDGADITSADYQLQSWWSSFAGFDFGATWEWDTAGRLPVLYSDI